VADNNKPEPLMRRILGASWEQLAAPVRAHFNVTAGSPVRVSGVMDEVAQRGIGRLLFPLFGLFGVLVPYHGRDVPFSVEYSADNDFLYWNREFLFPGKRPYVFDSRMCFQAPGVGVEFVRFGIGIVMSVFCVDGALVFQSNGFGIKLGRRWLPLPIGWLIGRARIVEWGEGDLLRMEMTLDHPWLGRLFVYKGRFRID